MSSEYFVLEYRCPDMMLLYSLPALSLRDTWLRGQKFSKPPPEPVAVRIVPGNEKGELLHYHGTACLMSDEFHAALREAGVDNLDVYDAVVRSQDGSVERRGYKVFNLLGSVRAADLRGTRFAPGSSRLIDASIQSLAIDPEKARGLLMFRLAEYVGAVIVHDRVRQVIASKRFPHISFTQPAEFLTP